MNGGTVLTANHLSELYELSLLIQNITVKHKGTTYGWPELCSRPIVPKQLEPLAGGFSLSATVAANTPALNWTIDRGDIVFAPFGLPCGKFTPLDCFSEGNSSTRSTIQFSDPIQVDLT